MYNATYENLEWNILLGQLADHARSTPARNRCLTLATDLSREAVLQQWGETEPLRDLIHGGYTPPLGELPDMTAIFKALLLGQTLEGEHLRQIYQLLDITRLVHRFAMDFQATCRTLGPYARGLYPLPKLMQAIAAAIGPQGEILDSASPELLRIRTAKNSLRQRIEQEIRQLLVDTEIETYLQDKFFTMRAERYVIPMRLDGRGRIAGSIYDTSSSGQTLYIEPVKIAPLNATLLELDLSEKLEILRIFRELSAHALQECEIMKSDYEQLVILDCLSAQAHLACQIDGIAVPLSDTPCLSLYGARHPLVRAPGGSTAIPNDILLNESQNSLVISGPNAGGKTVVLKTVGIIHLMAKAGLLIPADAPSSLFLFNNIYISLGDAQSITAGLSTFSGHIVGLKPIIQDAGDRDLVLLDELAVGTDPQTGSAIAQAILEDFAQRQVHVISSTHFDSLKGMPIESPRFRNGSMEFSLKTLRPTYHLVLDLPGQSYGLEVAGQMGLPAGIIRRATQLKGEIGSQLDKLVGGLNAMREEAREEKLRAEKTRLTMEEQRAHWQAECQALAALRKTTAQKLKDKYESQIGTFKEHAQEALDELNDLLKKARKKPALTADWEEKLTGQRRLVREKVDALAHAADNFDQEGPADPGKNVDPATIKSGDPVYLANIRQEGVVRKVPGGDVVATSLIEVAAGHLLLKVRCDQLYVPRAVAKSSPALSQSKPKGPPPGAAASTITGQQIEPVIPSPTNTIDLRGKDVENALACAWSFIDKAVLRGDNLLVIIHGHGTDRLKRALRHDLKERSPYPLRFRGGEDGEGGDGVTIVKLGD